MASSQASGGLTGRMPPAVFAVSAMRRASQIWSEQVRSEQIRNEGDSHRHHIGESRSGPLVPELLGSNPRAFGHGRHLGPDHIGIDRGLADPGTVAAIAASDDVFTADELGVAAD